MCSTEHIQELNRRNTVTVEQALIRLDTQLREQQICIEAIKTGVNALVVRIIELERTQKLQQVQLIGHGPTMK